MTKLIAIKGMPALPRNCFECNFIDDSEQYCYVGGNTLVPNICCTDINGIEENMSVLKSGRHKDCPLIEIEDGEKNG
jgi:hypothetical protein